MPKTKADVTINSRRYTVVADESCEYIKRLAEHIDEKVRTVIRGGQNIMGERPIVLAALNICDEYYKCLEASELLKEKLADCNDKIRLLNEQLKGSPQLTFDESEAEKKISEANSRADSFRDRLLKSSNELESAKKRIANLEERLSRYERNQKSGAFVNGKRH